MKTSLLQLPRAPRCLDCNSPSLSGRVALTTSPLVLTIWKDAKRAQKKGATRRALMRAKRSHVASAISSSIRARSVAEHGGLSRQYSGSRRGGAGARPAARSFVSVPLSASTAMAAIKRRKPRSLRPRPVAGQSPLMPWLSMIWISFSARGRCVGRGSVDTSCGVENRVNVKARPEYIPQQQCQCGPREQGGRAEGADDHQ